MGSGRIGRYGRIMSVLSFTDRGIYCPAGDFHIDPHRPVPRALITHGHSDHARRGHGSYLCTAAAAPVIAHRLRITPETIAYAEPRQIGDARVSFHPAGHVPGSAQIRVEVGGAVWVVSGDYKLEADGLCEPFEPVRCHAFITECTFGLPVFRWEPQVQVMAGINHWWAANRAQGRVSVLTAYSLGKAQRLLANLSQDIGPIFCHPAIAATNAVLRAQGMALPQTEVLAGDLPDGALVLTPNAASLAVSRPVSVAAASGWMALAARRRGADAAFVLSDHADWQGLNRAVRDTGATRVFATHGYVEPFRRWLEKAGYDAGIVA